MNLYLVGAIFCVLGVIFLILELVSPGIYIGAVGASLFAGGVAGLIWPDYFWKAFFVAAVVVLFGAFILFYLFYRKTHSIKNIPVMSSTAAGRKGVVIEKIDPATGAGKVRLEGETWIARSEEPIEEGAEIEVETIQGVTAVVKKI